MIVRGEWSDPADRMQAMIENGDIEEPEERHMIFRVRYDIAGGHVHCRLFSGKTMNSTFANCGNFCVTKGDEFRALVKSWPGADWVSDKNGIDLSHACGDVAMP